MLCFNTKRLWVSEQRHTNKMNDYYYQVATRVLQCCNQSISLSKFFYVLLDPFALSKATRETFVWYLKTKIQFERDVFLCLINCVKRIWFAASQQPRKLQFP